MALITVYKVKYKIVEGGRTISGIRTVENPVAKHVEFLRKSYPDATIIYVELLEEIQKEESVTAVESVILLGCLDTYDTFLP